MNVQAQKLSYGITAGININMPAGDLTSSKAQVGPRLGLRMEMDLSKEQPSGLYLSSGLEWSQKNCTYWGVWDTDLNYFEVPVHVGYMTDRSRPCKFLVEAGPYFSLGVWGKGKSAHGESSTHHVFGHGEMDRFDMGIGAKVGVQIGNHFQVMTGYDHGFLNLSAKPYNDVPYYNRTITASVAYMF